jgi:phosphoribosylamine---glycine ligase
VKVLVIGSGGREHALCWRLAQSPQMEMLYAAPGNPGTASCATNVPINVDQLDELLAFARREAIDLTVVGPEVPLCAGIQDLFSAEGLLLLGPTAAAAQLEGSKAFAKDFMERHGIPTAASGVFTNLEPARKYVAEAGHKLVVKADGLAAGKGVFVTDSAAEAIEALEGLFAGGMGEAGKRVVLEERLEGEEVSLIALCDGTRVLPLASSQDHKAAYDGDRGPNTGGMGAYSPAPVLDEALSDQVRELVLERTVQGMKADGHEFRGILYAGLMIVDGAPYVLEYNCRFGDPETQPLMARFDDDLLPYLEGAARGELPERTPHWDPRSALCVVLSSAGYPGSYAKGLEIHGLNSIAARDATVFHAGTKLADGRLQTAGGRVLGVTALGKDVAEAQAAAYRAVGSVSWDGMQYRTDIGYRALKARG